MKKNANKSGKYAPEHANDDIPLSDNNAPLEGYEIDRVETPEEHNQSIKERYHREYGYEIIDWEEMFVITPELATWLKKIVKYGNVDSQILIMRKHESKCLRYRCWLYTNDYRYTFSAHIKFDENEKDYLGGYVETRKPRPGENWHRGNDLPDGEYTEETFNKIVRAIVAYELKSLQLWRK